MFPWAVPWSFKAVHPVQFRLQLAADIHSYYWDLCAVSRVSHTSFARACRGPHPGACRVHWLMVSLQAGCPEGFMDRPLGRVCKPVKRTVSRLWDPQAACEFPSSISASSCSSLPPRWCCPGDFCPHPSMFCMGQDGSHLLGIIPQGWGSQVLTLLSCPPTGETTGLGSSFGTKLCHLAKGWHG